MGIPCGVGVLYRVFPRLKVLHRVDGTSYGRGVLCEVGVTVYIRVLCRVLCRAGGTP